MIRFLPKQAELYGSVSTACAGPTNDGVKRVPPTRVRYYFCPSRPNCVDLFYLHAPDHNTPIEDTLRAVHELRTEGLFRVWGVSNYTAWETVDIWHICK